MHTDPKTGRPPIGLQWFVDHAISKGGKCLSTENKTLNQKLTFECSHGHQWEATGSNVRHYGSWCPVCAPKSRVGLQWFMEHAISKGGKCVSTEYKNQNQKLKFECEHGHQFEGIANNIRNQGTWCTKCEGERKHQTRIGLQWFVDHASSKGGKCLSTEYNGAHQKLSFECAHGHQFEANANNVRNQGSWCPECANERKHQTRIELQWFVDHAISKGGKCLSNEYINWQKKLKFECAHGHQFEANANNVRNQGSWCPECEGERKHQTRIGLQWFVDHALSKGGKCLSSQYINAQQKLTFECFDGHQWEAAALSVRNNGTWCPECAGRKKK